MLLSKLGVWQESALSFVVVDLGQRQHADEQLRQQLVWWSLSSNGNDELDVQSGEANVNLRAHHTLQLVAGTKRPNSA